MVVLLDSSTVYPLVIAAHPVEPNQFALGLSDGGVQVLEPLESEGKWGVGPPFWCWVPRDWTNQNLNLT